MKRFILVLFAIIGVVCLLVLLAGLSVAGLYMAGRGGGGVPSRAILEIDFERGILEVAPDDPLGHVFSQDQLTMRDLVEGLERAAGDSRVKALVARVGGSGIGLAHVQEIRDAVLAFRKSGKKAVAWAETFGEFGPGNGGYYLATAFDTIYLQPSGDVGLTGLLYETPFVRGTLDKLEVTPRMSQRYEYKNAMNLYTEKAFTPAHRESLKRVMDSQFEQIVSGVAEARHKSEEEVRGLFDRGPYLGKEALDAGLVDGLAYRDEVLDALKHELGEEAKLLYLTKYVKRGGRAWTRGTTIALIHGDGAVTRGRSGYSVLDGSSTMGSDTLAGAFRAAARDRDVKAIVFRVDSPGGSYVASDTIWRETLRAKQAGKPVIVSMANLAGSGGYFVAMDADKIVAEPGTITASIGVLGGKLITRKFWEKLGITWDGLPTSAHSTMWSSSYDYDEGGWERFQAGLDRIYQDFTTKVAEGRKLPLDKVQQIARGRIWSGADAKELGLVDELGGLSTALRLAREAAGVAADAPIRVKRFPRERSPLEALFGDDADNSDRTREAAVEAIRALQPTLRVLRQIGLGGSQQALSMPDSCGWNVR
ncbi:MAG TPA: signal peptide peptidase SppA [Candidatus Polarisedimenticolaceae bacterium]|nr:signal peptide peptidase SppA [Candidatus Polarisedimenticolaceae bacterium]